MCEKMAKSCGKNNPKELEGIENSVHTGRKEQGPFPAGTLEKLTVELRVLRCVL